MQRHWQRLTSWFHLEPLLAVVLWGGVYPGAKLGLREIPVLSFTSLRILVAVAVLFVVSGGAATWRLPRALRYPLLWAGLAQTVFQVLLIASLRWTTAGHSAILLATAPLLTAGWPAHGGSRLGTNRGGACSAASLGWALWCKAAALASPGRVSAATSLPLGPPGRGCGIA